MNKKLGLAVAGALVAFSSVASAGITIPAGDWTVDIGGNVNAYYTRTSTETKISGEGESLTLSNPADANTIGTGLLPAAFGIGAKTRQNDLDIAFQFTFWTGVSAGDASLGGLANAAAGNNTLNIRQAFVSFGDASWGTIKAGRDLGVFGSDAILSDMTLLGVGNGGPAGGSSTLGRIGSGYIYADWKGQIQYTSPNWNGFQVTAAVMEPFSNGYDMTRENMGFEGKATYDFAANDVTGRVWASAISQEHSSGIDGGYTSNGVDVGVKAAYQGFGLVAYYYDGRGLDSQSGYNPLTNYTFNNAASILGTGGLVYRNGFKSDDNGGYVQGTFVVPGIGTKLGASWGQNNSKGTVDGYSGEIKNESWIIGAYHPLTKSLNLVAEYTKADQKGNGYGYDLKRETDTVALGAILFF
jgi:predicted porin